MARIPLVDIPNAPQVGPDPALIPKEGVNINMSGAAHALQQAQIPQDAFTGPGGALAKLGEAGTQLVGKLDNAFTQFADRKAMSKNYADLARADDVMQTAHAEHAQEIQSLPEDQWVPLWEDKYRPQVEQQLQELNLSPWSQDRVTPSLIKFDATTRTSLAYDAHKASLNNDAQAMTDQFNRQAAAGQYEQAHDTLANMERIGHITPEQSADMWAQTEHAQRINGVNAVMTHDPAGFLANMQQAMKDGKSDLFPWMTSNEINNYAAMAQNRLQDLRVQKSNDIYGGILSSDISDEKTLHAKAGDIFDTTQLEQFTKALNANPSYDAKTMGDLRTAVATYDPATDRDLSQYHSLANTIATTTARDTQGPLRDELNAQYTASQQGQTTDSTRRLRGDLYSQVASLGANGLLGEEEQNGGSDVRDVSHAALQLQNDIDNFFKSNSNASPADAKSWFAERTADGTGAAAAKYLAGTSKPLFEKPIGAYGGFGPLSTQELTPDELRAKLNAPTDESPLAPQDQIVGKPVRRRKTTVWN